jgi:hypothetical protein
VEEEKVRLRRPNCCLQVTMPAGYPANNHIVQGFRWLSTVLKQVLSEKPNSTLPETQCLSIRYVTSFCLLFSYSIIDGKYLRYDRKVQWNWTPKYGHVVGFSRHVKAALWMRSQSGVST